MHQAHPNSNPNPNLSPGHPNPNPNPNPTRPRLVRVSRAYRAGASCPAPPLVVQRTQEAGTREPHVRQGGPAAYEQEGGGRGLRVSTGCCG